jgi:LasA protease
MTPFFRNRSLFAFLAILSLTLACSIGADTSNKPIFVAPGGGNQLAAVSSTFTPEVELPSPTDDSESSTLPDPTQTIEPTPPVTNDIPIIYTTQAGDSLPVVAVRFGVQPNEIRSTTSEPLPEKAFLPPFTTLLIPHRLTNITSPQHLMPDSEVVYSPSSIDFDIRAFIKGASGYLSTYTEYLKSTGTNDGADIILRIAQENSINPRLLLSLLEYQSGWVYGKPADLAKQDYPLGIIDLDHRGLYMQLKLAVKHLSNGYYGWREGLLTDIQFSDGATARLNPELNAGTVAIQYFFAKLYDTNGWLKATDLKTGFPALHERMFGSPWARAMSVEPLYPPGLTQPSLILPFTLKWIWSFSGGPHGAWEDYGARAAIDFAPGSVESGCVKSEAWVTAVASGEIIRSENAVVILDLDGDHHEQTGWVIMYLHIASEGRILKGTLVDTGDPIGHPSCEGGFATGTHVHIARKYNGEWFPADGPIPFNLDGWIAHAGKVIYEGTLTRGDKTIYSSVFGSGESQLKRDAP